MYQVTGGGRKGCLIPRKFRSYVRAADFAISQARKHNYNVQLWERLLPKTILHKEVWFVTRSWEWDICTGLLLYSAVIVDGVEKLKKSRQEAADRHKALLKTIIRRR